MPLTSSDSDKLAQINLDSLHVFGRLTKKSSRRNADNEIYINLSNNANINDKDNVDVNIDIHTDSKIFKGAEYCNQNQHCCFPRWVGFCISSSLRNTFSNS